jgi:hypothetical protein
MRLWLRNGICQTAAFGALRKNWLLSLTSLPPGG